MFGGIIIRDHLYNRCLLDAPTSRKPENRVVAPYNGGFCHPTSGNSLSWQGQSILNPSPSVFFHYLIESSSSSSEEHRKRMELRGILSLRKKARVRKVRSIDPWHPPCGSSRYVREDLTSHL